MRLVLDMQLSATAPADGHPDQQGRAGTRGASGVLPIVSGVVRETRLIGHKGLPGDIAWIDIVVDGWPLVHRLPVTSVSLLAGSIGRSRSTSIHKGSGVGRIVQRFVDHSLRGRFPQGCPSVR